MKSPGIHPKGPGDQLDRRADIAYPGRLDLHGAAGQARTRKEYIRRRLEPCVDGVNRWRHD
jgi:hypothetical protein